MPDRFPESETREVQSDNCLPVGIPLAAVVAILFLFWFLLLQFWPEKL